MSYVGGGILATILTILTETLIRPCQLTDRYLCVQVWVPGYSGF